MEAFDIIKIAANTLNDKKALNIAAIKVDDLTVLTEYFIFASATSSTHVRSLAEEVEFKLGEAGVQPHHIEGKATGWILLDYGCVIIHVFDKPSREFYNLDKMWNDATPIDLDEILTNEQEQ